MTLDILPYEPSRLFQVLGLLSRELTADSIPEESFRRKILEDPNFRPEGALTATLGDELIGFMLGLVRRVPLEDAPPDFDRGWITLMAVDRRYQRRGIGSAMLRMTLDYLRREGAKSVWVSPYAPNYFCPGIDEAAYPGAIAFLRKHNFETAYRLLSMEARLPNITLPIWVWEREKSLSEAGVIFDTLRPEYADRLLRFVREEFSGDWQRIIRESIEHMEQAAPTPDQVFIASTREGCVGFSRNEGERFGPFGVARRERGRGIGAVLLARCLESMKSRGLGRAWFAWTDDNAARLYSQFGFRETRRYSVMRLSLNPSPYEGEGQG